MRDLKAHIALFAVAVVATLLTWNRDEVGERARTMALVWQHDTTDFRWLHYGSPTLDLRIERRTDGLGPYYWGIQNRPAESPEPLEFPVGWSGAESVPRLAALRALRDLGTLSAEQRASFGLADSDIRLTVEFTDEQRELVVGDSTIGGTDRYVLEPATGRGYVLPRDILSPIEVGEGALRERMLHNFRVHDVVEVRVTAAGTERTMVRTESGEWMEPGGETPDIGFGNFMERVDELALEGYDNLPPAAGLRLLLRIDYLDDDGGSIGFMELLSDDLAERDKYYLKSESTRIVARAFAILAERVEQAVGDIF